MDVVLFNFLFQLFFLVPLDSLDGLDLDEGEGDLVHGKVGLKHEHGNLEHGQWGLEQR